MKTIKIDSWEMLNMIESIKSKISERNSRINSAIIAGTTGIGTLVGIEKNKLNKMDLDTVLTEEYGKYLEQIKNNNSTIKDSVKLSEQNQIAKDIFNEKCRYGHELLSKTNKKNVLLGVAIGATVGILGVILKNKIFKGKNNENNSDKKSLDIRS